MSLHDDGFRAVETVRHYAERAVATKRHYAERAVATKRHYAEKGAYAVHSR